MPWLAYFAFLNDCEPLKCVQIVGLYKTKVAAIKALIREMIEQGGVFLSYDFVNYDPLSTEFEGITPAQLETELAKDLTPAQAEQILKRLIREHDNSYYQDSWDYSIEELAVSN